MVEPTYTELTKVPYFLRKDFPGFENTKRESLPSISSHSTLFPRKLERGLIEDRSLLQAYRTLYTNK